MATIHELLVTMKETIDTPEKWAKSSDAMTANGMRVPALHIDAVSWCLRGAFIKAAFVHGMSLHSDTTTEAGLEIMRQLQHVLALEKFIITDPVSYNDSRHTTHDDMMLLLKKAIALTED